MSQAPPTAGCTYPESSAATVDQRDRGPWALAAMAAVTINWRCMAILTGLLIVVVFFAAFASSGPLSSGGQILMMVWGVHLLAVVFVGLPLGVITSRVLGARRSLAVATTWFAVVGGVTAAAMTVALAGPFALAWFALGAGTAGGARAWAHKAISTF